MSNQLQAVYPWLQNYWRPLSRYLKQDRLPSALMLVGNEGLGVSSLAIAFAHRAVCSSSLDEPFACGLCEACLLFKADNYPDFFHVIPEEGKTSIKIEPIRQLMSSLALSNQYTKPRVVVIDPADAMSHSAANSLLKTLEEPSENTCLVLIVNQLSKVPATIRSRCQLITVKGIELTEAKDWLVGLGCKEPEQYLSLANNAPLYAKELWQKEALKIRKLLLNNFIELLKGRLDPVLFAEKCISLKGLPVLKWLMSWLSDAIKCAHGALDNQLMNPDLRADLKVFIETLHLKGMHTLLEQLNYLTSLESNQVNQQLMLEEFAIQSYSLTRK